MDRVARPVIVLGAARSGTKIFRDMLASHPRLARVPYDVNYLWKYGNYGVAHDELSERHARPDVVRYIRRALANFLKGASGTTLIEKTVGNTLRPDFVRAVFPNCRFINLIRDGRDVSASARRMWQHPMDGRSVLSKLASFPLQALPRYATQYAWSYFGRRWSSDGRVDTWGPRFDGIDVVKHVYPLLDVCGIQWRRCIQTTADQLQRVPATDRLEVRYEAFVQRPVEVVSQALDFLDLSLTDEVREHLHKSVVRVNLGKWRSEIGPEELKRLLALIGPTLKTLEYGSGK